MHRKRSVSVRNTRQRACLAGAAAGQAMIEYLVVTTFAVGALLWGGDQSVAAQLVHALGAQYQAFSFAISFTPQ